nr:hypothetical protein BaRGS_001743 [Batillaria attramentaria]
MELGIHYLHIPQSLWPGLLVFLTLIHLGEEVEAAEGKIRGNIIYLGHFESDFDWANETLRESRVRSKIASGRYHSQYYTNGSKCDLTGSGRRGEVRYLCEDGSEDYLARVDEPETCVYVLTVYTSRVCKHPHLKSPTPSQPIPISCSPLLSQDEYLRYQSHMEALRRAEEEARAKAKAELEQLKKEQAEAAAVKEDEDIEDDLATSVNTILKKSLGKEMSEPSSQEKLPRGGSVRQTGWKVVAGTLDELDKLLDPQGILSSMSVNNKDESPKSQLSRSDKSPDKEAGDDGGGSDRDGARVSSEDSKPSDETDDAYDEDDLDEELDEFDREVKRLRKKQAMTHKRLQAIRDRVQNAVSSQFKDIIEEAEAEVGAEMNEEVALKQLAASLNILMQKLESTEQEIKDMDDEINSIAASKDDEKKEKELSDTAEEAADAVQAPPTTKYVSSKVTAGTDDDGRWKVRVRTVSEEEAVRDEKTIPDTKQSMLETSVKQGLEKAGLDTDKVKVHVKIIGAKYTGGDDDDAIHILSEEDSASFQNMIVAILGGSNEAEKEQERHSQLESNYNFVFDQAAYHHTTTTATTTSSEDSADANENKDATGTEPAAQDGGL